MAVYGESNAAHDKKADATKAQASAEVEEFADKKKKIAEKVNKAFPGAATPFGKKEELAASVTKTEDGKKFPASDYAYVEDPSSPSTWKLRLTSTPGGDPDPRIVGAAVAALGKGFRGNKVELPADAKPKVVAKVRAAWLKANPDKTEQDLPSVLKASSSFSNTETALACNLDHELEFETFLNGFSEDQILTLNEDDLIEEFHNQCHDPKDGTFCEGPDGPGRIRDNTKKSEEIVGKKAPQYMKDMLSRKRGAAVQKGADLLPDKAPQYMKDMMKRKMEDSVINPKTPSTSKPKAADKPDVPAKPDVPTTQTDKGGTINRIDAAEIMHGTDSKQHKAAKEKFASKETKSESSGNHPASDYAYVPEGDKSSGWKLRLTDKPGGEPSAKIVGAAVAALGKGFRGNKVEIPAADRPKVVAKVRAAWLKANPDKTRADLPDVLKTKKG